MSLLNFCCRLPINISKFHNVNQHLSSLKHFTRSYYKPTKTPLRVTVCGAGGHIGQHLSLMLKQSPLIDELAIYDVAAIQGFGTELAHVDTKCRVLVYSGLDHIREALENSKVVVVVAASPKTSALAYSAMFEANAHIVQEIAHNVALFAPNALLAIATNPVNSLVPLASEVLKSGGSYNAKAVFGITALDVVRANTFVAEVQGLEPESVLVPVIGGNSDKTIVPVLSQAKPCSDFTIEELETLTNKIQKAHHEVIKVKSKQSATLSAAFAIARFVLSLVKGLTGQNNIVECAFVRSKIHHNAKYLSTPLLLGKKGIARNLGIPELSEYENCQLEHAIPLIMDDVKRGERFVHVIDPPPCDPCDPDPLAPPCPPNWCQKENGCGKNS